MLKKLWPLSAALLIFSNQANAESVTSVSRFEQEGYCFVTVTTIDDEDGTVESKTVKCSEYDAFQSTVQQTSQNAKAREFAEYQRDELKKAGVLVSFHQIIGLDPKIKWYPDLRLKALRKLTAGKTPAQVIMMIDGLDGLDMYQNSKSSDFYLYLTQMLRDLGEEKVKKAVFKDWSYEKGESGMFQYFSASLEFDGSELKRELSISVN